jgi:hypothetical protein
MISFHDFLGIFLHSLEFNPASKKYIYIFNYKGEIVCAVVFRPDLIILEKVNSNGICDLSHDRDLIEAYIYIIENCDSYVLASNS